jgi:hypothetical protein
MNGSAGRLMQRLGARPAISSGVAWYVRTHAVEKAMKRQ